MAASLWSTAKANSRSASLGLAGITEAAACQSWTSQAEFDGDKAKLIWPVSLDGKKTDSETYKVLGILPKATGP